jgi:hypothetical protein
MVIKVLTPAVDIALAPSTVSGVWATGVAYKA